MRKGLKYLSEVLCAGCAGIVIDYLAGQEFIFTLLGVAVGVILVLIQIIRSKKGR